MRRVKNMLPALFALALVATGAAMPFAASRVQDTRQAGVEVRNFDSFVLTLEKRGELSRILRFLTENERYNYIEVDQETCMSEAEAVEAAREVVGLLFHYGLVSLEQLTIALNPEASALEGPSAFTAGLDLEIDAQTPSFITWIVYWENLNIQIYLDDASGKAYQISVSDRTWIYFGEHYNSNTASTGLSIEGMYAQAENWGRFLEEYYEVKFQGFEEVESSRSSISGFLLYIDLEDGGDWLPMKLYFYNDFTRLLPEYDAWETDKP